MQRRKASSFPSHARYFLRFDALLAQISSPQGQVRSGQLKTAVGAVINLLAEMRTELTASGHAECVERSKTLTKLGVALQTFLRDESACIRRLALRAIMMLYSPGTGLLSPSSMVRVAVERILRDSQEGLRKLALEAISDLSVRGDPSCLAAADNALADQDASVRQTAKRLILLHCPTSGCSQAIAPMPACDSEESDQANHPTSTKGNEHRREPDHVDSAIHMLCQVGQCGIPSVSGHYSVIGLFGGAPLLRKCEMGARSFYLVRLHGLWHIADYIAPANNQWQLYYTCRYMPCFISARLLLWRSPA